MKTKSNSPISSIDRWKEGQWFVSINQIDNGVQLEENEGSRYEADFTIIDAMDAATAIDAFTRMETDPDFDQKVIDNIEVNGKPAIETKPEYTNKVEPTIFKTLPSSGWLVRGEIYSYKNGAVMVVQDHDRTIYPPEDTPALFSFYRTITEGEPWIVGEQVSVNATRTYNGKTWKCIQSHQTQSGWEPDITPALWEEIQIPNEKPPQWVSEDYYKYVIGYEVYDNGKIWKAINTTHTWIQPSLTGDGAISWSFVKEWIE